MWVCLRKVQQTGSIHTGENKKKNKVSNPVLWLGSYGFNSCIEGRNFSGCCGKYQLLNFCMPLQEPCQGNSETKPGLAVSRRTGDPVDHDFHHPRPLAILARAKSNHIWAGRVRYPWYKKVAICSCDEPHPRLAVTTHSAAALTTSQLTLNGMGV